MANARIVPPNAGSEMIFKILFMVTDRIILPEGRFLLSSVGEGKFPLKKASLFFNDPNGSYVGDRNLWIKDEADFVTIAFVDYAEGDDVMCQLAQGKALHEAVRPERLRRYSLRELSNAAIDVKYYLLKGIVLGKP